MSYEYLTLRPADGVANAAAIAAWLDAQPWAWRGPEGDRWFIAAGRLEALAEHREAQERGQSPSIGILVAPSEDEVIVLDRGTQEARLHLELLARWLSEQGEWWAEADGARQGSLDELKVRERLFGAQSIADHERLTLPVHAGCLTEYIDALGEDDIRLTLHDHGPFEWRRGDRQLVGRLDPNGCRAWRDALDEIEPRDANRRGIVEMSDAVVVDLYEPHHHETLCIDPNAPPPSCAALIRCAKRLIARCLDWREGPPPAGIAVLQTTGPTVAPDSTALMTAIERYVAAFLDDGVTPEVTAALDTAVEQWRAAGAPPVSLPGGFDPNDGPAVADVLRQVEGWLSGDDEAGAAIERFADAAEAPAREAARTERAARIKSNVRAGVRAALAQRGFGSGQAKRGRD